MTRGSGEQAGSGLKTGFLELEDGTVFRGELFGSCGETDGEVVFNTGMVGYPESMTDPSYRGQILAFTYPLIGSYGVPDFRKGSDRFESDHIQVRGIVVQNYIDEYSHHEAVTSLDRWMKDEGIAGIQGIDTRELTKILRNRGTMLGRIVSIPPEKDGFRVEDPNSTDLVSEVTSPGIERIDQANGDSPNVLVMDCGCKRSIVSELAARGLGITVIPYDHDPAGMEFDGIMISNGPGDPSILVKTIENVGKLMEERPEVPISGICLGCQILALAAGGRTYKLPFGHRSQNQPSRLKGTESCVITSQNHGYAVDGKSLPAGWEIWYENLNDGSVEGIRHSERPYFAVQFHPEASPGPTDSRDFFDRFAEVVRRG
ncbi:MAG: glutamine-hydrolyzing carbamoyl-phosphate synthase small subunit [Thermoplasmatota archaeon]